MSKTAILIGATGLVGRNLLEQLLVNDEFGEVRVFVRRSTGKEHPKLKEYIINFDLPEDWQNEVKGDVLFSCLGTTIKTAGSKKAQYLVDYTYQLEFAKAAAANGVPEYSLVSSSGANSKSIVFYTRMKGELEEAVEKLGFTKLYIFQPSVLDGERPEARFGEEVAVPLSRFLAKILPPLKKYRAIKGSEVAKAMLTVSLQEDSEACRRFVLDEIFNYVD